MKKIYFISAIALAALSALVSCNKDVVETNVDEPQNTVTLTVNAVSPDTKTVFGEKTASGYPITWAAEDEAIELVELLTPTEGSASYKGYPSTGYTLSDANAKAVFSASVEALSTEGTYDYHALYPQSAYKSANTQYKDLYAIIPDVQTPPSDASPEADATLLYAGSTGHSTQPTSSLDMSFSHITAYGKMTIKDASDAFDDSSETISSVTISVPAGGIYYYWETGNISAVSSTKKDAVTIKTDNLDTSGDFVAWFACAPYSLAIGDELTVSVTTDANTYTREITMTKAMSFESGKVSKFTVDMSSASAAGDLSGDYLIVSTDATNPWHVMSYDSSIGSYLGVSSGVAAATSIDTDDASTDFSAYCVDSYVWKLAKVSGGYSLQNANTGKYVSWSSGNSATAVDVAATLVVTDTGSDGVYTVKHSSDESRILQYNYNSGTNPRFAFYTSSQKTLTFIPVTSYKYKLATPTISSASSSGSTITVTWAGVEHASSYTVTCTGQTDQTIPYGTNTTTFTGLSDGTYTVTVTAVGSGDYVTSEADSEEVSVGSAISFSWTPSATTSGYTFTMENGNNKTTYIQDKDSSTGLDLKLVKTDGTAIFSSTPTTITLMVKVGGGSTKDPLTNNVIGYLIDSEGNNIASTATTVTTKVENTTGKEYSVTMPLVSEAYGIRISHAKETSYNIRVYAISFSAN